MITFLALTLHYSLPLLLSFRSDAENVIIRLRNTEAETVWVSTCIEKTVPEEFVENQVSQLHLLVILDCE